MIIEVRDKCQFSYNPFTRSYNNKQFVYVILIFYNVHYIYLFLYFF